eukprot:6213160-Pleurochrysis_carterae.AAC.2
MVMREADRSQETRPVCAAGAGDVLRHCAQRPEHELALFRVVGHVLRRFAQVADHLVPLLLVLAVDQVKHIALLQLKGAAFEEELCAELNCEFTRFVDGARGADGEQRVALGRALGAAVDRHRREGRAEPGGGGEAEGGVTVGDDDGTRCDYPARSDELRVAAVAVNEARASALRR